jgi:Ca-activated chloride channel family protein
MDLSELHFAQPLWLWVLLAIPLIWGLFFLYYQQQQPLNQLEKFIDKHLIPHLLLGSEHEKKRQWHNLLFWSLVWSCLTLALAGPRWDFREAAVFTRDQNLAILLDLSESMNAKDVSPSRLGRAKQKIEDLLNMSKDVKIGLIAFAADPHMVVPMTEDKQTIRHLLPSLDTHLVYVQGSKLTPALEMAAAMLENEPGSNKAIAVISDGGFEDASAIYTAKKLAEQGILLYSIGVGTQEGAALTDNQGAIVKKDGSAIISKLEREKFQEISNIGHGRYFDADHTQQVALIFDDLEKRSDIQQEAHKTHRFWEERFYLLLLPVLPFFLWWYQRGYIFALLFLTLTPTYSQANLKDYFYNNEQHAKQAYEDEDYTAAAQAFQDHYRKGVSLYRMGDYAEAEEMFRLSTRPEVASSAAYNLGNALALQEKLKEASTAYEEVLEKWPDHKQARENLEIVKKLLEQQEQQQQDSNRNNQDDNENSQENADQQKDKQDQQQSEKKDNSQKQEHQKPSQEHPSKDLDSEEETESSQNQENTPQEETPQDSSEEQQSSSDTGEEETAQQEQEPPSSSPQEAEKQEQPSQDDQDADLWLSQIKNDPHAFLKNKFYLESKKNGTKQEVNPW